MGIYEDLKAAIADVITTNGKNEITGAILNDVLQNVVSSIGEHATFAGIATPDVQPGTVDQNVFYLATIAGTYIYFDEIVVNSGEVAILTNKTGSWKKKFSGLATQEKLTELEKKVSNTIIDSEMSDTSENAVSNKVIKAYVDRVKGYIDDILGKNVTDAIDNINEILAFLSTISDKDTLAGIFEELKQYIDNADNLIRQYIDNAIIALAAVAKSGSYNDLIDKPIIPAVVTESTISEWGFTKNTGTIKGVIMNGVLQKESDGNVNLGTVITDISGKQEKLISGTNIKTLNGISLLGSGNIQIGGSISRVEMTSEIASIKANEFYVWQMVNSLNITLISGSEKVMNRYIFQFRNPKETTTLLTLPDDITWSTDTELDNNGLPIMEASAFCRIEIIEGLATLKKWKLVYIQFADKEVERVLMSKDIGDGIGITKRDAAAVTDMSYVFGMNESITEFDEFQYFTGVTRLLSDNISANHGIGFMGCVNLRRLTLPKSLTKLGNGATIQYSGAGAFHSCKALVYIGNTSQLDFVGDASFYLCESLPSIDLSSATRIGASAFEGCIALSEVLLSDKLAQVWGNAFHGCTALKGNILLGANVTTIAVGAFYNVPASIIVDCPQLSDVGGFMSYKDATFALSGLEEIRNLGIVKTIPGTFVPESPLYCWAGGSAVKRINIENVTDIGAGAFYSCQSMTEAVICPEVVNIGRSAFGLCTSLALDITDKLLNVTSIGAGAFKDSKIYGDVNAPKLTTMPNAQYNNGHFNGTNVARILSLGTIPALPSGYGAYAGAFANCKSLWYVRVHDVTSMGQYTFYGCTALDVVIVGAVTPPSLHWTVFDGTNSAFIIYVPDASVEAYKAATNWNTYADRIKGISEYTG